MVLSNTIVRKISLANGVVLLLVPLVFHLVFQYLVTYHTAPSFRHLDIFQQVIHILANTDLVFPLRSKNTGKQEHRCAEIFWSFVLMTVEMVGTSGGLLAIKLINTDHPRHFDDIK